MKQLLIVALDKISPSEIGLSNPATDANATLSSILTLVYTWAGIVCVLTIVIAGIFYATSSANAANIKRAKDAIVYAIVGLVVIIMAFAITQFVLGRF